MARIDWRFVVGFVMAWLVATGALVAAGVATSAPEQTRAAQPAVGSAAQAMATSALASTLKS